MMSLADANCETEVRGRFAAGDAVFVNLLRLVVCFAFGFTMDREEAPGRVLFSIAV